MKKILVLGAGRSSTSLISYLLRNAPTYDWEVTVADMARDQALLKITDHAYGKALELDLEYTERVRSEIQDSQLVISLLPASMHPQVAKICLETYRPMLTASYVSDELMKLDHEAKAKGVLLLNECGLDPGLDHMTAIAALDRVRSQGGEIDSFISYTGGLIAPESEDNPWRYKFTWNPRNVVLAGRDTARFIRNGRYKYIPYHKVFSRLEQVGIRGYGAFEGYANRNSLKYRKLYGLDTVDTMIRGTLRRPGFCAAWDVFVQLGMTDDSYILEGLDTMTYRDFVNTFLYYHPAKSVEEKLCDYLNISSQGAVMQKLNWLGIFDSKPINIVSGSPASVLQHLLESKWEFRKHDRDMIVMQHQIGYKLSNKYHRLFLSLVTKGDEDQTAMSKTVGWPLAIAAKLVLSGVIKDTGVKVPVSQAYYVPILEELSGLGVQFIEQND